MIQTLKTVVFAFAAIFVGAVVSVIPPLPAWLESVDTHRNEWLVVAGCAAAIGLLVMMSGILWLIMERGKPLTHEEAEDVERSVRMAAKPVTWRATAYKVLGTAVGGTADDEFSFHAMKEAWHNGTWRIDPIWQRRYLTAFGAALMATGIFSACFAAFPPPVKVLLGGAFLYALTRTMWGFWRA